jgi:DNA polymerase elongation subunit (family B)
MEPGRETPLYGLDIETDTTVDGLDPSIGRILAVAVVAATTSSPEQAEMVQTAEPEIVEVFDHPDEAELLGLLDRGLASLPPGVLVTWNGARFDLPYLATRAERHGVGLGLRLRLDPSLSGRHQPLPGHQGAYRATWHHHHHLDAYRLYQADVGPALRLPCSLKVVASLAGLAPVEVDASKMHELSPAQIATYVRSDARCTAVLARRRWATAQFAVDRS